jgi:hypothetical protein
VEQRAPRPWSGQFGRHRWFALHAQRRLSGASLCGPRVLTRHADTAHIDELFDRTDSIPRSTDSLPCSCRHPASCVNPQWYQNDDALDDMHDAKSSAEHIVSRRQARRSIQGFIRPTCLMPAQLAVHVSFAETPMSPSYGRGMKQETITRLNSAISAALPFPTDSAETRPVTLWTPFPVAQSQVHLHPVCNSPDDPEETPYRHTATRTRYSTYGLPSLAPPGFRSVKPHGQPYC